VITWRKRMQSVGARDLKQHTGEVIARVRGGERLLLTVRGRPVAVISPLDEQAVEAAISHEVERVEDQGWLTVAADAFAFWNNDRDAVWDSVPVK
jgi:prevent-host-death family protein